MLTQLLLILKNYQKDPYFASLIADLEIIKKELEPVKITIEKGDPESIEENGMLKIIQHERSVVSISPETLQKIIIQTEKIRNKLIL